MVRKVWLPPSMLDTKQKGSAPVAKPESTGSAGGSPGFRIKISLKGSQPKIWRRVVVKRGLTFQALHHVIQIAMGWHNCHLHQFHVYGEIFGPRRDQLNFGSDEHEDESKFKIGGLGLGSKNKVFYEYDFGDGWLHEILVEKLVDDAPEHPVCLAGELACPPEDCGGVWGYQRLLAVLKDPKDPEHEDMKEWIGEDWDAERFDLAEVNRSLKRL